ncbi:MAG: cysteine synthase A [Dehalococcoidales bacterium]|nr:cysteine synthase A [Dehalococcoidales bacterium]
MTKNILDLVGNTPVVELAKINNTKSTILAKLEALNPSGSIKDVMALYMIDIAEKNGMLKPGNKIIEATSGNTGISFAMLAPLKGCEFVVVMPEHMSKERRQMMRAFGAEIVLTPEKEDFAGALERLEQLAKENQDAWLPRQFDNPDNIAAHREITGKRILEEIGGRIDVFVAGVGTGGTLMGVAEALKGVYRDVRIVAVEPAESAVMSGGKSGSHIIQGIGPGFIPSLVNMSLVDEVIKVKSNDALDMTRRLIKEEGLMVGISSGANVLAALEVAQGSGKSKTIVTILPDRGERYLSTNLF